MSLVIGKERAVSHSCLVASTIDMPEELEEEIENLEDIFQRQMRTVKGAAESIRKALEHPLLQNWPHVEAITQVCADRARYIMMNDYIRAMSYGAMRMVNSRLTDVLNAILPVKQFLDEALAKIMAEEKKAAEKEGIKTESPGENMTVAEKMIEQLRQMKMNPIPRITITPADYYHYDRENESEPDEPDLPCTPNSLDDEKTPTVDNNGELCYNFETRDFTSSD